MSKQLLNQLRMGSQVPEFDLRQAAADAIVRLHADIKSLRARIRDLEAENKRLKAAIKLHVASQHILEDRAEAAEAEVKRLHDLHLERTHLTTRMIKERDAAEAKLASLVEGLKGLKSKCLCASEHHSRLGLEGPDPYWQFARDLQAILDPEAP